MKRTQIYLTAEQHEFLESLAFYLSRKENRKTTISELIRQAIGNMQAKYGNVKDETDMILESSLIMEGLEIARNEKGLLTHNEVFGE